MQTYYLAHDLVFLPGQIVTVYQLEPVDLIILPEQEQQAFLLELRRTLHSIQEGNLQIIMRTRKEIPKDLARHFQSFQPAFTPGQEQGRQNQYAELIRGYISRMSEMLEKNIIPVKEYYLVMTVNVHTRNQDSVFKAIEVLDRMVNRIGNSLKRAGIEIEQVRGAALQKLFTTFNRK